MPTPKTNRITIARRSHLEYHVNLAKRRNWYADEAGGEGGETTDATKTADATKTDAKMSDDELQKFKDKIAGNLRKEAKASVFKDILTQLGADPNDEKAVENIKARLAKVQEMEDAQKSTETKLQERLTALEKERDEAKADAEKVKTTALAKERDDAVKEALREPKLHCKDVAKVFKLLRADHQGELDALMKADGTLDTDKVKVLVELGKKENPEYFTGGGPGIPSNMGQGARASELDDNKKAREASFNRSRRAV